MRSSLQAVLQLLSVCLSVRLSYCFILALSLKTTKSRKTNIAVKVSHGGQE